MCGRYGRRADKQRIAEWMQTHNTDVFDDSYLAPSYNVAPQSLQPVVRLDNETGVRELSIMRWGLIPFWSKDSKIAYSTINAKAETITTSPTYREAIKRRRCLVPADWFYEWKKMDAKTKQPYAIALNDGSLFAFAGLWDTWKDKATGQAINTYTVITTDPNQLMEPLHNRMPVILQRLDYDRWLAPADPTIAGRLAQAISSRRNESLEGGLRSRQCEEQQPRTDRPSRLNPRISFTLVTMRRKPKASATKTIEVQRVYRNEQWTVHYGTPKPGRGRPELTARLFSVLGEKLPYECLNAVKNQLRKSGLTRQGVYVAHDSMGCARYIGGGATSSHG